MGGDYTRSTFGKKKHYRRVRMQQGRVQLDADWNEQVDIDAHHEKTFLNDLAGASGTPVDSVTGYSDGFKIVQTPPQPFILQPAPVSPGTFVLADSTVLSKRVALLSSATTTAAPGTMVPADTAPPVRGVTPRILVRGTKFSPAPYFIMHGRYYVDGILCENEDDISADKQPDLPLRTGEPNSPIPSSPGIYLSYLDVWERELTCIEDPLIREVALLGPDTAVRTKTVWQAKLLKLNNLPTSRAQPAPRGPALSLSSSLGGVGSSLTVNGSGFVAGEQVTITMGGRNLITDKTAPTADAKGSFSATFPVPKLPPAQYSVTATGNQKGDTASTNFTVITCATYAKNWPGFLARAQSTVTLRARAIPPAPATEPCILPPKAGYTGLENQLYRVEVHDAGVVPDPTKKQARQLPTFKWSRDNATVLAKVTAIDETNSILTVSGTGKDGNMGFMGDPGQTIWVEVTSDTLELWGEPGVLAKLKDVGDGTLTFDPTTVYPSGAAITNANFPQSDGPKVRRWDCNPAPCTLKSPDNYGYLPLEQGVEVKFEPGTCHTGDYWLIPARTATASVEWPQETVAVNWNNIATAGSADASTLIDFLVQTLGVNWIEGSQFSKVGASEMDISGSGHTLALTMSSDSTSVAVAVDGTTVGTIPVLSQSGAPMLQCVLPSPLPPKGIRHHFEQLAMVQYDLAGGVTPIADCRGLFPALTDVMRLTYVSGDGQTANPDGSLSFPLMAAAPEGRVRFTIVVGGGTLTDPQTGNSAQGPGCILDVTPDPNGVVTCNWNLDTATQGQRVEADLLDTDGNVTAQPPLYYNAFLGGGGGGISANAGIVELDVPANINSPTLFGPFQHFLNAKFPPAVVLGYVGYRNKQGPPLNPQNVQTMEDQGLYASFSAFTPQIPLFKAVLVDTQRFSIVVDRAVLPTGGVPYSYAGVPPAYSLVLRWWAIPGTESKPQSGSGKRLTLKQMLARRG